jgi:hypothetical protein
MDVNHITEMEDGLNDDGMEYPFEGVTPVSIGQSRVHSICVPGSISTHMVTSQV